MITQAESGLTAEQYAAFQDETNDPVVEFLLEAYSLQISTVSDVNGTATEESTLDAIVCDDTLVRIWNGTNEIVVGRLATEDAGPQAWSQTTVAATSLDETVPPSLAVSGNTVRIFWYDGSAIKYFESADKGASWGAAQTVYNTINVKWLAASSTTRVHYVFQTADNNMNLRTVAWGGSSWSNHTGEVYWPFAFTSFDAIDGFQVDDGASATNQIIAATTDLPPLVRIRVDGTQQVKLLERVQAVVLFRYQNGRWSDHIQFDVVDRTPTTPARTNVRLSSYNSWLFMTYKRWGGTPQYPIPSLAISRSRSGIEWEMPYLLDESDISTCAVFLVRGIHCYLVDSIAHKCRSPRVNYAGGNADSAVIHDLSDNVMNASIGQGDIKSLEVTVASPEGELDSLLDQRVMWQMRLSLGYSVSGTSLTVQTVLADLESVSRTRALPTDHRILSGRDALSRMASLRADLIQEWENQQAGGDNYQSTDGTDYSGLRHTAGFAGHWEAHENQLQLRSGEAPGVAFNTQTRDVWNGSAQCAISVASTASSDFAGLIFRGLDKYTFWHYVYDAEADALKLNYRRNNEDVHDPCVAGKGGMGWNVDTWYWLKVIYRYNLVKGYYSTDGATWTLAFSTELAGVPSGTSFTFTNVPVMRGSMGYYGHGYSAYTPSWPSMPYIPIPIEIPDTPVMGERLLVATDYGIYMTGDLSSTHPTWVPVGTALIGKSIVDFAFNEDNNRELIAIEADAGYGSTSMGNIWMISDYRTGEWVKVLDGTTEDTALTALEGGAVAGGFRQCYGFDDHALVVANYNVGIAQGHTRVYLFSGWGASGTRGNLWDNNDGWGALSEYQFLVNVDHGMLFNKSGTVNFCGQTGLVSPHDCRMDSGDYGLNFTIQENGPAKGVAHSQGIRGGLNINGSFIVMATYDSAASGWAQLQNWVGGLRSGRVTIEDWTQAQINGIHMGYRRQVVYGTYVSYLYPRTIDSSDPVADGQYGWTYWYKDSGYPGTWETVSIPIYCRCADSFWDDAEDRIAMGNRHAYVADLGDQQVFLLTAEGTSVANKSGTGATGLYGLGTTYVTRVLFDQWED